MLLVQAKAEAARLNLWHLADNLQRPATVWLFLRNVVNPKIATDGWFSPY